MSMPAETPAGVPGSDFSRIELMAMIFVVCTGFSSQMVMPLWIGAIIDDFGFSVSSAGTVASFEFGTVALVSILVALNVRRLPTRPTVILGLVLLISGNLFSAFADSFAGLTLFRCLTGAGKGLVVATVFSLAAGTSHPTRTFAMLNACYALFATMFYLIVPIFIELRGASGVFFFMSGVALAGAVFMLYFPSSRGRVSKLKDLSLRSLPGFGLLALLGLVVLWSGHNAVWTFIERLGLRANLTTPQVGLVLSVSFFLTIGGPTLARVIDTRWGMNAPIIFAASIKILVVVLITCFAFQSVYFIAVPVFLILALFIVPYVMGILSVADPAGRLAAASSAAMTAGSSLGALLGGWTVDWAGYPALAMTAGFHFLVVILIFVAIAGTVRRFTGKLSLQPQTESH